MNRPVCIDREDFSIEQGSPPPSGMHIAFAVDSAAQVDAFHAAALTAGGRGGTAGAAGGRGARRAPAVPPGYYGAYVLDRAPPAKPVVGNNVEVVCHGR